MEATKVDILPATMRLNGLSRSRKSKLRREIVKEYINSKPAGTELTIRELGRVAGINVPSVAFSFITRMVKRGEITREKIVGKRGSIFTVPGSATVITPARPVTPVAPPAPPEPEKTPEVRQPEPELELHAHSVTELSTVARGWATAKAKQFAWQYNSNDLREFINFLETSK